MNEYDNKYDEEIKQRLKNILEKIVTLPEQERWNAFSHSFAQKEEYDRITELLMKAQNETFFRQLKNRTSDSMVESGKVAKQKFSSVSWMQALKYTIEKYEEDEKSFIVKFKTNYKMFYNKEYSAMKLKEMTGGMVVRQRQSVKAKEGDLNIDARLYRLIKVYLKLEKQFYGSKKELSSEDFNKFEKEFCEKSKCSKGDFELVKKLAKITMVSQYSYGDSEDEEYDILESQSYNKDTILGYTPEEVILMEEEKEDKADSIQKGIERIKMIFAGSKVKEREFFRTFFTKDILCSLKLEQGIGENGEIELKCGNTHRYQTYPAGNEAIYDVLKLQEYDLINELFHMEYIRYAIEEQPENLEELFGIYYNLLHSDFQFTDRCMAQAIGTTPQKVSRYYNEKYVLLLEEIRKHGY